MSVAVEELKCEVCNKEPALGVASCLLCQPVSVAYGEKCLTAGIEAWHIVVGTVGSVAWHQGQIHREALAEWALEIIDRSLAFHGKTWDDLAAVLAKAFDG